MSKYTGATSGAGSGNLKTYISGFALSVALTLVAFWLVSIHLSHNHTFPSDTVMMLSLAVLAVVQLFVQLIFFLHLGRESRPRWNALVLGFAAIVVLIVVIGSIWIMQNLNYRMMRSPQQIQQYLNDNQGI